MIRTVKALLTSLAFTTMINANITGTVTLTDAEGVQKKSFSHGESLHITVEDSDLNTSASTEETTMVTLTSGTETTAETLSLKETGVNTGIFTGEIMLQAGSANEGDLILQAQKGETISCLYNDVSDDWGKAVATRKETLFDLTTVSGKLEENLIWTKAKSPYLISGEVVLESDYTLMINPGVTVLAADTSSSFRVKGKLKALGTKTDSIHFSSLEEAKGAWKGLELIDAQLQYVSIKNAETGILWKPIYGTPTIMKHSSIVNSKKTPLRIESSGSNLSIENSYLASAEYGPMLVGIYAKSYIAFRKCTLANLFFNSSSTSDICFYGNQISGNIDFFNGSSSNMELIGNEINGKIIAGQEYHTGKMVIQGNNFGKSGILEYTGGPTIVEVKNNNFNAVSGTFLNVETNRDLDARFNYWGETTTKEILEGPNPKNLQQIHDNYDREDLGTVNYSNWLEEPYDVTPIHITKDVEDQVASEGAYVIFKVEVSGGFGNVQYQWLKDNVSLPNETSAALTFVATPADTSKYFSCRVIDNMSNVYSSAAKYTLRAPLAIAEQPAHLSVFENTLATFSVKAMGGSGEYTYQWYYGSSAIPGATDQSYSFTATAADTTDLFTCKVYDYDGSVTSSGAYLFFIQVEKDTVVNTDTEISEEGDTVITKVETITTTTIYPKHDKSTSIQKVVSGGRIPAELLFAPNPARPGDNAIHFLIPEGKGGDWDVTILDALGNTIDHQEFYAHEGDLYRWDLRNKFGQAVASGTYKAIVRVLTDRGETYQFKKEIGVQR